MDLGAENFLIASTITAIVAQRIVRRICPSCKEAYPPPAALLEEIKQVLANLLTEKDIRFHKGKGGTKFENLGYVGRVGIYEVLTATEKISKLIISGSDSLSLEKEAIEEGMITLKQDGYLKVIHGETTIEEVLRVAQE